MHTLNLNAFHMPFTWLIFTCMGIFESKEVLKSCKKYVKITIYFSHSIHFLFHILASGSEYMIELNPKNQEEGQLQHC